MKDIPKKCGECKYLENGFLSEPDECRLFGSYTGHFVNRNSSSPKWCPLKRRKNETHKS